MSYFIVAAVIITIILIVLICFYGSTISAQLTQILANETPSTSLVNKSTIPKIIIQTWKSNNVPQRYMPLIESVKQKNPDYEYLFFTDRDIETFLKQHYPQYLSTYMNLPIKIQKIDFFRYIAVYHYGGFYLDLDMKVYKNFDPLLKYDCIFPVDEYIDVRHCAIMRYKLFCDKGQNFLLGQYAFAASPRHPFIKKLIDQIANNANKYIRNVDFNSEDYVYKTTGPDFVTEVYMNYTGKRDITIIDNGIRQHFGDYAKHNYFGTWK